MPDASILAGSKPVDFEAGLIRRARFGDTAAFEKLYRRHVGRVYALSLRISADPALAEELTQEIFLRTWERIGSFRGESRFSTWLHRLAINMILGNIRDRARRPRIIPEEQMSDGFVDSATAPPGSTDMDLDRAIASLPERARLVLVLHDIEGYLHEEIAAMMGVSVGTCKAQLHRARRILREALES